MPKKFGKDIFDYEGYVRSLTHTVASFIRQNKCN